MGAGYGQKDGEAHPNMSPGLPMSEREHDHTTTKATLTEGTILLNKDTTPVLSTALELGINTDLSQANSQVAQTKDVKAQIQEQQQIATAVGYVKSAVETYTSNQREAAEQEIRRLKSHLATAESQGNQQAINKLKDELIQAETQVESWGAGGVRKLRLFKKENGLSGYKMAKLKLAIEIESLLIKEIVSICGGNPSGGGRSK